MDKNAVTDVRRVNQHHSYTTLQMHEAVARKAGFSGTDHKYLGFLLKKGPMTAGELATLAGLTTGAITGLIDRFEKKKLVKRTYAEDDRRKVIIVPVTKNITALMEPLYKDFRSKSEEILSSFSAKELKVIQTYLSQSTSLMEEITKKLNKK